MTALISTLCVLLIGLIIVQIGRVTELAAKIRGEEEAEISSNNQGAFFSLVFMVVFLVGCVVSGYYYKDIMLWYGPHESASEHGVELDYLFNITLFFTGIVFILTQFLLFWFAYKYKGSPERKALFISHDNKLEIIWTAIPAVVMTFLVVGGLDAWNEAMADVPEDAVIGEDYIEIEATGMQFNWIMRYPGPDNLLGTKHFRKITSTNQVGLDFTDPKSLDDVVAYSEVIKLPVNKLVRVRITARDVLHNFDLPHFRVKMDAIPGLPTYFKFKPTITTAEYRENLGAIDKRTGEPLYPEWHEPADPTDPESKKRYEEFHYELACAELCGKGHYSMRRVVEIVSEEEWMEWRNGLQSFYFSTIRGKVDDPYIDIAALPYEKEIRGREFITNVETAVVATEAADRKVQFRYLEYKLGSAELNAESVYELDRLAKYLNKNRSITVENGGHTDNTGNPDNNIILSEARAKSVQDFLVNAGISIDRLPAVGYGQTSPIDTNDTAEGRQNNRRTELKF